MYTGRKKTLQKRTDAPKRRQLDSHKELHFNKTNVKTTYLSYSLVFLLGVDEPLLLSSSLSLLPEVEELPELLEEPVEDELDDVKREEVDSEELSLSNDDEEVDEESDSLFSDSFLQKTKSTFRGVIIFHVSQ